MGKLGVEISQGGTDIRVSPQPGEVVGQKEDKKIRIPKIRLPRGTSVRVALAFALATLGSVVAYNSLNDDEPPQKTPVSGVAPKPDFSTLIPSNTPDRRPIATDTSTPEPTRTPTPEPRVIEAEVTTDLTNGDTLTFTSAFLINLPSGASSSEIQESEITALDYAIQFITSHDVAWGELGEPLLSEVPDAYKELVTKKFKNLPNGSHAGIYVVPSSVDIADLYKFKLTFRGFEDENGKWVILGYWTTAGNFETVLVNMDAERARDLILSGQVPIPLAP